MPDGGRFPDIISDDTFVRLQFAPAERVRLDQTYQWPLVEGLARLVRVRRRQNKGVAEVAERFPGPDREEQCAWLLQAALESLRRALRDPAGFCVYAGVALTVRTPIFARKAAWDRGR